MKKDKNKKRRPRRSLTCRILSMMFAIILFNSTVIVNTEYISNAGTFGDLVEMEPISDGDESVEMNEDSEVTFEQSDESETEQSDADSIVEFSDDTTTDSSSDETTVDFFSDEQTETEDITSAEQVTFTQTIDNVEVTATADAGVIQEDATLAVRHIKEGSDQYIETEEKLSEKAETDGYEIAGFLAYDIYFQNSAGEKIEPADGKVKVSLSYNEAAIPETVQSSDSIAVINEDGSIDTEASETTSASIATSVSVMHLVQDTDGNVQSVEDMTEDGNAKVETDAEGAVQKAEFETDSFSTFTITWKKTETFGTNLILKYVDQDGNEIDASQDNVTITNTDEVKALSSYANEISNYTYKEARLDSSDGTVVTHIRLKPLADGQSWTEERTPQVSSDYGTAETVTWKDVTKSTVIYLVYQTNVTPTPVPSDLEVSHQKYIKKNNSGKYDLTLNVAGSVETETTQAKVDVLLIVDTSTSMTETVSGKTRIQAIKDAVSGYTDGSGNYVKGLVADFTAKNIDAQYRLVTFGNYGNINTDWVDGSALTSAVNSLSIGTGVGTNYDQGLTKGKDALSSGTRSDATKIVIFLTDGQPTFYGSTDCTDGYNNPSTYPNGRGDSTNEPTLRAALNAAKNISCDKFYAVGFNLPESIEAGSKHWIKNVFPSSVYENASGEVGRIYKEREQITNNYTDSWGNLQYNNSGYYNDTIWINDTLGNQNNKDISGEKLLGWVTSNINAEKKETCNLTTPEALQEKFSEIANSSTAFACSNVTITDTLSDYVQTTTDSALQIKVMKKATDSSGNVTYTEVNNVTGTAAGEEKNPPETTLTLADGTAITAKYDATDKKVTLNFPDNYTLEEDYCYYVTITNLEPTDKAYNDYKSSGYNAAGDKLTDASGDGNYAISTGTSSEQSGFYSNTTATVTYTYKENKKTLNYAKPVIQVVSSDIVKSKTVKVANWDERTYNITLKASSTATELSQANPVEVVLVFDKSGSMHFRSSVAPYKTSTVKALFSDDSDTGPYYYITNDYKATMYRVWRVKSTGYYYYYGLQSYTYWTYYCIDDSYWNYSTEQPSNSGKLMTLGTYNANNSGNYFNTDNSILNLGSDSYTYQFYTDDGIVNNTTYDRLYYLQKAANSFIDDLAAMSPESKVALVTFAADASKDVGLAKLNSTQVTELKSKINNISTSSNTRQDTGLDAAKELLESDTNSDKLQRYVILLTDGCPNDPNSSVLEDQAYDNVTTSVTALKALPDKPTLMTIAVGLADNEKLQKAKTYLRSTVADADSKGNKYAYEADSASQLTGIFQSILKSISQKVQVTNADIKDYIDSRFELTNKEIERLKEAGATVGTDAGGQYVLWKNQTIAEETTGEDGKTVPGWTKTFKVKAKDSFIGDNDVTTNGSGSGVIINGQLSEFEQPTVNVKAQLKIADKEVTIYKGDTVPTEESILNQIFAQTNTSYKNGTIGNDATIEQLIKDGRITIQWYTDKACTQSTTVDAMSKATPDSETKYYRKVTYRAQNPTDESNANTTIDGKTYITGNDDNNGADDKTVEVTGVYTVKVISGAIDINKTTTAKDGTTANSVTTDTKFTFKVTKSKTDEQGNNVVDTSFSKAGWINGSTTVTITVKEGESAGSLTNDDKAKLTGLSRGTYTVEEINNPEEYKTSAATVTLKDEDNGGTDCKYLIDNTTYVTTFKLGYKNDEADIDVIIKTTDKSGDVTDYTYVESNGGVKGLVSYTNKLVTADLDLKKVDAKNDIKNLSGAKFKLEKCDTSASDTWTTVENFGEFEVKESGTAELTGLKAGRYRLTEVTAPTGYNILGDTIYFQVTGDGDLNLTNAEGSPVDSIQSMWTLTSDNSLVLTIKNTEIYSLPSAGGPGIYGFTISGVAFITAALLLFINNKRREGDIAE